MKYIRIFLFVLSISLVLSTTAVFAEMQTVSVPNSCSVTDTEGGVHEYSGQFLGICALVAAKIQGAVNSYTLTYDASFGFYLLTLNGVAPGSAEYWALYQNDAYANDGLSSLVLANGDTLSFQLTDWSINTDVGSPISFTVSFQNSGESGGRGGGGGQIEVPFNLLAAVSFLSEKQKTDGSFGADFITDWVAIALAGTDPSPAQELVRTYLLSHAPTMSNVTDYERHAMALMALDINPYTETGTDYVTPIVNAYDGTQIGDSSLVNDDIFALFPLPKAGYGADIDMIQHIIAFILAKQGTDGSWEGSVDLTAAAIQALSPFQGVLGVTDVLANAAKYLRAARQPNGKWGNSFEASWVVQALHALNIHISTWIQDGRSPMSTLASAQQSDGGVEPTTREEDARVWATAYAIPAALGKPWNAILQSFPKPTGTTSTGSGDTSGTVLGTSTPAVASTTPSVATSTPASSTPSVITEMSDEPRALTKKESTLADVVPTFGSNEVIGTSETSSEIPTIDPEQASTSPQLAAVGVTAGSDTGYLLILPFLLIVAALLSALAFGPLQRLLASLLRRIFGRLL